MTETQSDPLDVLLITVQEYYYIPRFLNGVIDADDIRIVGITTVPPSLGTQNIVSFALDLLRRFGPRVFAQHARFYLKYRALDTINRVTGRGQPFSPATLAQRNGIEYHHTTDVNSDEYVAYAESLDPDVIASVAATQKFESDLLDVPSNCAINIHSSLLPDYRGVSPSFWTLLHDEEQTGITVHYMHEDLDAGDVVRQRPLSIRDDDTLHSLNERVAETGSDILVTALKDIRSESVTTESIRTDEGSYYSAPTREDVRRFLDRGNQFF